MIEPKEMQQNVHEVVKRHLRVIQVPEKIVGFNYLEELITMAINDESILGYTKQKLYSILSEKFQRTGVSIDDAMKYAMCRAYQLCDANIWCSYFGEATKGWTKNSGPTLIEFTMGIRNKIIIPDSKSKLVEETLNKIGISKKYKGYVYLKDFFILSLDKGRTEEDIYKELTQKYKKTFAQVKSACEKCINEMHNNVEDRNIINDYFGNHVKIKSYLTYKEFIEGVKKQLYKQVEENKENESISKHLKILGVPVHKVAYKYLTRSIELSLLHFNSNMSVYRILYMVAVENGKILNDVQAITHRQIKALYENEKNLPVLREYFGDSIPTIASFVKTITRRIVNER